MENFLQAASLGQVVLLCVAETLESTFSAKYFHELVHLHQ